MSSIIVTKSSDETREFAVKFAAGLKGGEVIALVGELGAGKTLFVQGLAAGFHISRKYYVNSPTFTILNIYEGGKMPIYHFDWYRLGSENECLDIGLEEYFDGKGVSVIEWADKFPKLLPEKTVWIKIDVEGEKKRRITVS
ncbi:MAG: tRNA (adenosine(37)-N6)-threonylcarbamoyltransferase complex ATPase subunit type 1 TsaE [Deltaproteobacteria bacterium]|nr:tRNA (adenosine(37)-N6)-threonylcarbamoyltransferase complex ATPase subunit type 1 TsaE [Deltaproteobacteria bacterium]MBI2341318.1 tRNA (adenosine(37)-N6)-threonylcarbamoyltransferase complex ATPase subunit type 1 TsaE [Deltaproteobacteria bacterium]